MKLFYYQLQAKLGQHECMPKGSFNLLAILLPSAQYSSIPFGPFLYLYRPMVKTTHLSLLPSLITHPQAFQLSKGSMVNLRGTQTGSLGMLPARIQATQHSSRQK